VCSYSFIWGDLVSVPSPVLSPLFVGYAFYLCMRGGAGFVVARFEGVCTNEFAVLFLFLGAWSGRVSAIFPTLILNESNKLPAMSRC